MRKISKRYHPPPGNMAGLSKISENLYHSREEVIIPLKF